MSELTRPKEVDAAMRELKSAFIDVTIHAQSALKIIAYIEELERRRPAPEAADSGISDERILEFFRGAGMTLEPTPNALYTVRGQHAQLVEGGRALLAAADAQRTDAVQITLPQLDDIRRAAALIRENSYPQPDKPHSSYALAERLLTMCETLRACPVDAGKGDA